MASPRNPVSRLTLVESIIFTVYSSQSVSQSVCLFAGVVVSFWSFAGSVVQVAAMHSRALHLFVEVHVYAWLLSFCLQGCVIFFVTLD